MGPGGAGQEAGEGGVGLPSLAECLDFFQSLDCARVCTNSASDCQSVLTCAIRANSFDNCTQFTSVGISLAISAKRNCCND